MIFMISFDIYMIIEFSTYELCRSCVLSQLKKRGYKNNEGGKYQSDPDKAERQGEAVAAVVVAVWCCCSPFT